MVKVMNQKVRIIKRADRSEPQVDRMEPSNHHPTREITTTIKLWITDFRERRRADEQNLTLILAGEKGISDYKVSLTTPKQSKAKP